MSKKSHIPLVPRTANYSCALPSRLNRKKAVSIQTDRCICPFEIWLESNNYSTEGFVIDEDSIKTYKLALECVNAFHSHMNKTLDENFDDMEGKVTFKLPEVPNYSAIFFLLLDKVQEQQLAPDMEEFKEDNSVVVKESVAESLPGIKHISALKIVEEKVLKEVTKQDDISHLRSDDIHTIMHHLRNQNSVICSSKTVSSEFPAFCLKTSSHDHGSVAEDGIGLEIGTEDVGEVFLLCAVDTDEQNFGNDSIELKSGEIDLPLELSSSLPVIKTFQKTDQCDTTAITKIIKQHIQEEFVSLFDKHQSKHGSSSRLVQSHFHVINIPPQINLLEYAQKKLERQLTDVTCQEPSQKKYTSHPISTRKSLNITSTPKKVTNMFRKYSQTKFRSMDAVMANDALEKESNQSDDDSVILDDEEFEKINGYVVENSEKKQTRESSAYNFAMGKEKSNPLKLTVRDMSRVNEKVLHSIGLFTERGDVRPGVMDILEEQKKAKAKDVRNKQFRVRRQWDLQVHLRPKDNITSSFASTSSKSFISVSSTDLRSDLAIVKNTPQRVIYDK